MVGDDVLEFTLDKMPAILGLLPLLQLVCVGVQYQGKKLLLIGLELLLREVEDLNLKELIDFVGNVVPFNWTQFETRLEKQLDDLFGQQIEFG